MDAFSEGCVLVCMFPARGNTTAHSSSLFSRSFRFARSSWMSLSFFLLMLYLMDGTMTFPINATLVRTIKTTTPLRASLGSRWNSGIFCFFFTMLGVQRRDRSNHQLQRKPTAMRSHRLCFFTVLGQVNPDLSPDCSNTSSNKQLKINDGKVVGDTFSNTYQFTPFPLLSDEEIPVQSYLITSNHPPNQQKAWNK